jgi:hypothetical protein
VRPFSFGIKLGYNKTDFDIYKANTMKQLLILSGVLLASTAVLTTESDAAKTAKGKTAKTKTAVKAPAKTTMPAFFYDETWSYRTGTLYDKKKNIVSSVSGEAKFGRDGKFEQNYYIGSIGNFYKGTYKIIGNRLVTYDEKGKQIFDYRYSIGSNPKILVLSLFEDDGTKSMDFSLVPLEKKKP